MSKSTILRILKWLLVLPVMYVSGIGAWIIAGFVPSPYAAILGLSSHLRLPVQIVVDFVSTFGQFLFLSLTALPVVFCICWALGACLKVRIRWGVTTAVLLMIPLYWRESWVAALTAGIILAAGALTAAIKRKPNLQWAAIAVGFCTLTVPIWVRWIKSPTAPPSARKVWSTVLQKGTWQAMNTGSSFSATRQVAFSGDRIVAVLDAGSPGYTDGQPMSTYRIVSIRRSTGRIENSREFEDRWGNMRYVFGTSDGHVVLTGQRLELLNPDLSSTGTVFVPDRGRAIQISPDGRVIGWELDPGTALISANTLKPTGIKFSASAPSAITSKAALLSNVSWYEEYPNDRAFITINDGTEQRPIFHGSCGANAQFLSDSRILSIGCGEMRLMDTSGGFLRSAKVDCCYATFAGVSQNGRRFALHFHDERGDPPRLLYERFVVYDSESLRPLLMACSSSQVALTH